MRFGLQLSRFGGVAVLSAATDYTVFTIIYWIADAPIAAQVVARLAGGLFSFFANKYWSFGGGEMGAFVREGRRFWLLFAVSYVLALGLFYGLMQGVGLPSYPAKLSADTICFFFNFLVMKLYVFSGRRGVITGLRILFGKAVKAAEE